MLPARNPHKIQRLKGWKVVCHVNTNEKQQPWDEGCYIKIKLFTHQGGISVLNTLSPNKRTSESMK